MEDVNVTERWMERVKMKDVGLVYQLEREETQVVATEKTRRGA